jgi:hypothetical protein
MNERIESFLPKYTEIVQNCERHLFASVDAGLKRRSMRNLTGLARRERRLKLDIIREEDENAANQMLALQCLTNALRYELKMWIEMDNEQYDTAWNVLIDAQGAAEGARSAHRISHGCSVNRYLSKLDSYMSVLFPPQQFNSPAIFVEKWECNLCGTDYSECPHIAGEPYWGFFCQRKAVNILDAREMALVNNPKDKKARIYEVILDENTVRDQLTWDTRDLTKEEREQYGEDQGSGLRIKSIAMTADDVDPNFEDYFP